MSVEVKICGDCVSTFEKLGVGEWFISGAGNLWLKLDRGNQAVLMNGTTARFENSATVIPVDVEIIVKRR